MKDENLKLSELHVSHTLTQCTSPTHCFLSFVLSMYDEPQCCCLLLSDKARAKLEINIFLLVICLLLNDKVDANTRLMQEYRVMKEYKLKLRELHVSHTLG